MMTDAEEIADGAETPKYRVLVEPFLKGCGLDIGTGGYRPVVPHAIAVEQDETAFAKYTSGRTPEYPLHLRCGALELPFDDESLDFVYASHLIEDFYDWIPPLNEWTRVLKNGGHLVLLYPDAKLWSAEIARGRCPNCQHRHESFVGEMSGIFSEYHYDLEILEDRLTALTPEDYTIIFVARKIR